MKKLGFLGFFFGFLLLALDLSAAPISYKQAAHYAAQHFQTVAPLYGNVAPSLLYTSSGVPSRGSNDGKDYYVFGKPAGTGFVIVAGDDALPTILAYSDEGNFPVNDLPPHIASYLEGYSLWVAQARARGVQYTQYAVHYGDSAAFEGDCVGSGLSLQSFYARNWRTPRTSGVCSDSSSADYALFFLAATRGGHGRRLP